MGLPVLDGRPSGINRLTKGTRTFTNMKVRVPFDDRLIGQLSAVQRQTILAGGFIAAVVQSVHTGTTLGLVRSGEHWRAAFSSMGSPCELRVETPDEALARRIVVYAQNESRRIDRKYDRGRHDSPIRVLNQAGGRPQRVDEETARLIDRGVALWRLSEGRFDLTAGWHRVSWKSPVLTLPAGMEIGFGSIARGYTEDRVAEYAAAETESPVLVDFGGNLRCTGRLPRAGAWRVGIESIEQEQAGRFFELQSGALVTHSGGRHDGRLVEARAGRPIVNAPRSLTVAAPTCSQASGYATLAMLRGEDAEAFLDAEGVRYWSLR